MSSKKGSFADRLPDVVLREEEDISHLSDDLADILYPGRRPRPFRIGFVFREAEGEADADAVALARKSEVYRREESEAGGVAHHAAFGTAEADLARALFDLVGNRSDTEILVDGRKLPYGRELWLPLFWLFVGRD